MMAILITLFLCGDVMAGRGIDQILPYPSDPKIYEISMRSAFGYVELALQSGASVHPPVDFSYVWGDIIRETRLLEQDVRIVNLETAVTRSDDYWPGKGINYRMSPQNAPVLTAAGIDVCSLANNHVLDWGYAGLEETTRTLADVGIRWVGAGADLAEARAPAVVEVPGKGRVLVFACGMESSGIPSEWAASEARPGVHLLRDLSERTVWDIRDAVRAVERPGDIVVLSIHWGGNWDYSIREEERTFVHRLIDLAGVDVVHGHSSHHAKGIEVYRGRLILYGAGDFLNDYEGIGTHDSYRGDLGLMYFASLDATTGRLESLEMIPTRIRSLRVNRASVQDARWLAAMLNREGARLDTRVHLEPDGRLILDWQ